MKKNFWKKIGAVVLAGSLVLHASVFAESVLYSEDKDFDFYAGEAEDPLQFAGRPAEVETDLFTSESEIFGFSSDFVEQQAEETCLAGNYVMVEAGTKVYQDVVEEEMLGIFLASSFVYAAEQFKNEQTGEDWLRIVFDTRLAREENENFLEGFILKDSAKELSELDVVLLEDQLGEDEQARVYEEKQLPLAAYAVNASEPAAEEDAENEAPAAEDADLEQSELQEGTDETLPAVELDEEEELTTEGLLLQAGHAAESSFETGEIVTESSEQIEAATEVSSDDASNAETEKHDELTSEEGTDGFPETIEDEADGLTSEEETDGDVTTENASETRPERFYELTMDSEKSVEAVPGSEESAKVVSDSKESAAVTTDSDESSKVTAIVEEATETTTEEDEVFAQAVLSITEHPANVTVAAGGTATFTVTATGSGLTYQWQTKTSANGSWMNTGLNGCKTSTLSFAAQESYNGRAFRCIVKDGSETTQYSNAASLTVSEGTTIKTNPKSVTVSANATATFTVTATGDGLTYQWQTKTSATGNWMNTGLNGAKTPTLSFKALASYNGRYFRCMVNGTTGNTKISGEAMLTVAGGPPITKQPQDATVGANGIAVFTVEATGTDLIYQWQYRKTSTAAWANTGLNGCKTAELRFKALDSYNGRQFRCVVSDADGESYSDAATLTIGTGPAITQHPADVTVAKNATATFTVVADGSNLTYRWQTKTSASGSWMNTGLGGYNTDTLEFTAEEKLNNRWFRCLVSNGTGSSISQEAHFVVTNGLIIKSQPKDVTVTEGETVTYTIEAGETGLSYQWQTKTSANGSWMNTGLAGNKNATLSFVAKLAYNARWFRCRVTDSNGNSAFSNAAYLTVNKAISQQPEGVYVLEGGIATFKVKTSGSNLTYQWQTRTSTKDGWMNTGLNGCKTDTLSFKALKSYHGRQFRCIVTIGSFKVESNPAPLSVLAVSEQPVDIEVDSGETATFTATAQGTDLIYQWQTRTSTTGNWMNTGLNGCKTSTLSFSALESYNGRQFRCVIKDGGGNRVISEVASLMVSGDIVIDLVTYKRIDDSTCYVYSYAGKATSLVVPDKVKGMTVVRIGDSAFEGNTTLESIDLPDTITVIGKKAFKNCTNLKSMT